MSLRPSFQHGCDFRSHPGCRLSLPCGDILVRRGQRKNHFVSARQFPMVAMPDAPLFPIPLQTAANEAYCYGL